MFNWLPWLSGASFFNKNAFLSYREGSFLYFISYYLFFGNKTISNYTFIICYLYDKLELALSFNSNPHPPPALPLLPKAVMLILKLQAAISITAICRKFSNFKLTVKVRYVLVSRKVSRDWESHRLSITELLFVETRRCVLYQRNQPWLFLRNYAKFF